MRAKTKQANERRLARAFDQLFKDCVAEALARGAKDPQIYFESESGLVVLDGAAHDGAEDSPQRNRVLFQLPWPAWMRGHVDVGAW